MNETTIKALTITNEESDVGGGLAKEITSQADLFFTAVPDFVKDPKKMFNAMQSPDYRISDKINEEIKVKAIFAHTVQLTNEETGEVTEAPRFIFFDDKGETFTCVSRTIMNSVRNLFAIYGNPDAWGDGIKIKFRQINKGTRRFFNIELL